ncbi:MFS transporter [Virgibacillus sp. 7505]|uniref:MFS transporter n=1 Tax=Virgibacillus sp. 7505 TaxID=2022548 RepID=UPI000BA71710|nr:MFS transporter [Virgibacillus sp. 7505]PAE16751.1 MFS transporter [Virgibacillus sp. 7505]
MWKIIFPGIAMVGVTYAFARLSFGLFLPNITVSLGLSESNAGFASSAAYIAYSLALVISSYIISRFGQKRVIQFSGLSAIIGLIVIALSNGFFSLICGTFIAGLGSGWASPAFSQVAATSLTKEDSDRGNTWINTGTSFGLILSGPIALLFAEQWRFAFIVFATIALAVLIWNSVSIPAKDILTSKQNIFKYSIFNKAKFILISSLIIGIGSSIFWTFSRTYLAVEYKMSSAESSLFWVIMGASGVVGGFAGGLINRIGLTLSYRIAITIMASAILIITIPTTTTIYLSSVFFGISYIFITGILIVWSSHKFAQMPSIGVSLSFLALGIGQSIGSSGAGEMIDITTYTITFVAFSLFCLIGLLVPVKRD